MLSAENAGYKILNTGVVVGKYGKLLKTFANHKGYPQVALYIDGKKNSICVHRIVALKYVDNKCGKPDVNHKDECKTNNNYTNLEWVTNIENINHGTGNARRAKSLNKAVIQSEKNGVVIKKWGSAKEACDVCGFDSGHISSVCSGSRDTHGGFIWEYA